MTPAIFHDLAEELQQRLCGNEILFSTIDGEDSDFVRLNQNRVRQAGHVRTASLTLTLIDGQRQVAGRCDLSGASIARTGGTPGGNAKRASHSSGHFSGDLERASHLLEQLRARLEFMPDDPYLNFSTEPTTSMQVLTADLPAAETAITELTTQADGLDLVGIWASGEMFTGLASSLGHRHWHGASCFNLDWSTYLRADQALKANYSGFQWESSVLGNRIGQMRTQLTHLAQPVRTLNPGRYRAYLEPAAVMDLVHMLGWDGFDLKSQRTQQSPLLRLLLGERQFAPHFHVSEDNRRGLIPGFSTEGFLLPAEVPLIVSGRGVGHLANARDAKEFGESVNATSGTPHSVTVGPGTLDRADALAHLDTGLWIGNLWYCNWSDPNDCRVTGMTRFGTFWVENGAVVAPVNVMRFDDSLYHLFGDRLEALTQQRDLLLATDTYGGRSTDNALLPGLLVAGIELTL